MCARTAGVAEAKRLPNAPDPPAEGGAFRVGPPHRCEGKLPQLRVHEDYARRGASGPSASRSASCGAPSDGPCWLLRSVRTGVQAARAVDNDGAEIQACPLTHGPSSWCRPPGALRYSRCHQHAQLRLGPVPTTAHTCVLPTAQIREAALTHRQMRTSLSPAAAAIQPWMGGGKSAQKPPRRRRTTPSIMPKQPGSASLSDSSLKQPTGAQRASGRASLSGEQARRARSKRLPGPGRARGVASPQHPPSFWPPPPPRSSPAAGHAPFNIAPRRRWADRRPYRRAGLPGAKAWWRVRRGDGPSARARPEGLPRLRSVAAAHRLPHTF